MFADLLEKDYQLLVAINQTGSLSWDTFWLLITNAWNWVPFFALILWANFHFFPRKEAWRIFFLCHRNLAPYSGYYQYY